MAAVAEQEKAIGNSHGHGGGAGSVARLFHLAVPPSAFESVVGMLGASGLASEGSRVIIEKPFGWDLASAK